MSKWYVHLEGHEIDLKTLSERLNSSRRAVIEFDPGAYYLRAESIDLAPDATTARKLATEIIRRINGANKLQNPTAHAVSPGGSVAQVAENGNRHIFVSDSAMMRAHENVTLSGPPASRPLVLEETWLDIAGQDARVAKALRLFGLEHTWANLYKVLDIIEEDVGGRKLLVDKGWASVSELDSFTGTANNARVLGDEARHGHERWKTPRRTIDQENAAILVQKILRKWIDAKSRDGGIEPS